MGNRVQFSTTCDESKMLAFKNKCKEQGIPQNLVLEWLMDLFISGKVQAGFVVSPETGEK